MTITEIIEKYSRENGFDGLFNESAGCACFNGDLLGCGFETNDDCEFGYKKTCPHCNADIISVSKDHRDFQCPECEEIID